MRNGNGRPNTPPNSVQSAADLYHRQLAGQLNTAISLEDLPNVQELRHLGIEDIPWVYPPPGHRNLNRVFVIPTPPANATDTVITQLDGSLGYRVPVNYFACFRWISLIWTGTDFPEFAWSPGTPQGMVFRILADGNPIPDWGQITNQVGTSNTPAEVSPILAKPNSLVQVVCNNVSLNPVGNFVAAVLRGFIWPRPAVRGGKQPW